MRKGDWPIAGEPLRLASLDFRGIFENILEYSTNRTRNEIQYVVVVVCFKHEGVDRRSRTTLSIWGRWRLRFNTLISVWRL